MAIEHRIAQLFHMTDEVWARHASAWSVWTRVSTLPVLLLALWSHVWLGWWALVPIAATVAWIWLNPRIFAKPRTTDTWGARVTFGERIWLDRKSVPIPAHHRVPVNVLSAVGGIGFAVAVVAALLNAFWPTVLGAVLGYGGKLWFCDRMVWIYEDMKDTDPRYRSWLY